jgi:hypothetical protein
MSKLERWFDGPGLDEPVEIGQWYWVKKYEDEEDEEGVGAQWLGCVTHVGSNYVEISRVSPHQSRYRIHFDRWLARIDRRECRPELHIEKMVGVHRLAANALMKEIKQLTARLGLTPAGELPAPGGRSTALVVAHGKKNIDAHKRALVKAKEKTLPDLFKKVTEEHEAMAMWMKAKLIPMKAESRLLKKQTGSIEDRIFTVELYAGLVEELVQIKKGKPAGNDEKIHLFQRRHYMDEECLVEYEAGGMEFRDVEAFDRWLMKKANRDRILPFPKCVVAFRVRRNDKRREAVSLSDFLRFHELDRLNKLTFLYIRNGNRYYRLNTGIDFGHELFPDNDRSYLTGGKLYISDRLRPNFVTEARYNEIMEERKERKAEHRRELAEWKKLSKAEKGKRRKPYYWDHGDKYELLSPDSVYYDDIMIKLAEETRDHNRIAVVLQGLLDRSPAFHPHPPWRIWTPEGFAAGIERVYDSCTLSAGPPPDFEAYRDRLNALIKKGSHTVGQQRCWYRSERERRESKQYRYGNPGPGRVAQVVSVSRDKTTCAFKWERERLTPRWVPSRPGWQKKSYEGTIAVHFRCKTKDLFNVDAYEPGDFKQFYQDPRTRADYLKWAPLLLEAEDFHAKGNRK